MKKIIISIILLLAFASLQTAFAQSQYEFLYQSEAAIEVFAETAANGDILLAMDSYNDTAAFFHRFIVQRLDVDGNIKQTAGLFRPPSFRLGSIKATSDNGLLMMGTVNQPLSDEDSVFVTKLDDMGQESWTKGFQVEANIHVARGAIETNDGSSLVYGTYEHINFAEGIFLLKINTTGTLVWSRTINSQLMGAFMKLGGIVETSTGDYWLSGSTRFNSEGSWLAKLNSTGETQSVIFYDTHKLTPSQPEPFAIFQRASGELDIFYNSTSFQSGPVLLAIRTDVNGMPTKTTRFYNGNDFGEITAISPSGDGGYVGCGYRFPGSGFRSQGMAMKIGGDYSTTWARSYGTDYIEITTSIFPASDGGHVLGGFADFDSLIISPSENGLFPWLIKTDGMGETTCYDGNTPFTSLDTTFTTMTYQLDNVPGVSLTDIIFTNIPVVANPGSVSCTATAIQMLPSNRISMYPNPSEGKVFIDVTNAYIQSVEVLDLFGRQLPAKVVLGREEIEINIDYKGIAIVRVHANEKIWSGKVIFK